MNNGSGLKLSPLSAICACCIWRCVTPGRAGGCRVCCLLLVLLVSSGLRARELPKGDGPVNAATRSVHDEAVRILNSIQLTEYRHKTDIDETKGDVLLRLLRICWLRS